MIGTIDKTVKHLKGTTKIKNEEIFVGFSIAAGNDRFGKHVKLGGIEPIDCKMSGQDPDGSMCAFEVTQQRRPAPPAPQPGRVDLRCRR